MTHFPAAAIRNTNVPERAPEFITPQHLPRHDTVERHEVVLSPPSPKQDVHLVGKLANDRDWRCALVSCPRQPSSGAAVSEVTLLLRRQPDLAGRVVPLPEITSGAPLADEGPVAPVVWSSSGKGAVLVMFLWAKTKLKA